jgi:hypothetical protein
MNHLSLSISLSVISSLIDNHSSAATMSITGSSSSLGSCWMTSTGDVCLFSYNQSVQYDVFH